MTDTNSSNGSETINITLKNPKEVDSSSKNMESTSYKIGKESIVKSDYISDAVEVIGKLEQEKQALEAKLAALTQVIILEEHNVHLLVGFMS